MVRVTGLGLSVAGSLSDRFYSLLRDRNKFLNLSHEDESIRKDRGHNPVGDVTNPTGRHRQRDCIREGGYDFCGPVDWAEIISEGGKLRTFWEA